MLYTIMNDSISLITLWFIVYERSIMNHEKNHYQSTTLSGFIMIEAVCALGFVCALSVIIGAYCYLVSQYYHQARNTTQALLIAHNVLERLRISGQLNHEIVRQEKNNDFRVTVTQTPVQLSCKDSSHGQHQRSMVWVVVKTYVAESKDPCVVLQAGFMPVGADRCI